MILLQEVVLLIGIEQDQESFDIAESRVAYYLSLFKESNAQTTLDDLLGN